MASHPNNIADAALKAGYGLSDFLPAYPGLSEGEVDAMLRDSGHALTRPVIDYGLLGQSPVASKNFNVSAEGFRSNGTDRPLSDRGDGKTVYFFGGSTTVGYNIADRETVPARLEARLNDAGDPARIFNFGGGGYMIRNEFLRFLALLDAGRVPDVAVFMDGVNDCHYALGNRLLIRALDTLYRGEKKRQAMGALAAVWDYYQARDGIQKAATPTSHNYAKEQLDLDIGPLTTPDAVRFWLDRSMDDAVDAPETADLVVALTDRVWTRYLDTAAMIDAVAARHGVKTVFVWHPIPFLNTRADQRILPELFEIFPVGTLSAPIYRLLRLRGFPGMADRTFIDASEAPADIDGVAFNDICHFTAALADVVAARICDALILTEAEPRRRSHG